MGEGGEDFGWVGHAAWADGAAGLPAGVGADGGDAVGEELFEVALGGGVEPHGFVHGGGDEDAGGWCGEEEGGDEVVGEAVGHFGEDVGGGGCDKDEVGGLGEADVGDGVLSAEF